MAAVRSHHTLIAALTLMACCFFVSVAPAGTYREAGDAPFLLPGQATIAAFPLERIHGYLADSADVDVYRILVFDPVNFSASVVNTADFDAQLFLFNSAGLGVTHDDDTPPGGISGSTITLPAPPIPGF